jgi:hypothetical protein
MCLVPRTPASRALRSRECGLVWPPSHLSGLCGELESGAWCGLGLKRRSRGRRAGPRVRFCPWWAKCRPDGPICQVWGTYEQGGSDEVEQPVAYGAGKVLMNWQRHRPGRARPPAKTGRGWLCPEEPHGNGHCGSLFRGSQAQLPGPGPPAQ